MDCDSYASLIAGEALDYFGKLYGVEREVVELDADERRRIREAKARPIARACSQ